MPKRPAQHQIEDRSRAKLGLSFPREWLLRDKDKDYGVDAEVEIFEPSGEATGLVFLVQLKATESVDSSVIRDIDFNLDRLNYYSSMELPVLICRYSCEEDLFYYKWASSVDTCNCKPGARTVRVKFSSDDVLCAGSMDAIREHVKKVRDVRRGRMGLPVKLNLAVMDEYIGGEPRGLFIAKLSADLKRYRDCVELEDDHFNSYFSVVLFSGVLTVDFCGLTALSLEFDESGMDYKSLAGDIVFGVAVCLARMNMGAEAARVFLKKDIESKVFERVELIINLIPGLISSGMIEEVTDLLLKAGDGTGGNLVEAILHMSLMCRTTTGGGEDVNAFSKTLNYCLNKYTNEENKEQMGVAHYNLANHLSGRGLLKEAFHHYVKAKNNCPFYLEAFYFYKEVAAVLFRIKKYRFASHFYKKAMGFASGELRDEIKPFLADSLMFSGKYHSAVKIFDDYLDGTESLDPEWLLKSMCLKTLIDNTRIQEQIRDPQKAQYFISEDLAGESNIEEAIKADCLCALAWFNLGVNKSMGNEHKFAAFCFCMCGLIQSADVEAWVNAFLCSLNKEVEAGIVGLIFTVANYYNGEEFLFEVYSQVGNRFEGRALASMHGLLEMLKNSSGRSKTDKRVYRIHGFDGGTLEFRLDNEGSGY